MHPSCVGRSPRSQSAAGMGRLPAGCTVTSSIAPSAVPAKACFADSASSPEASAGADESAEIFVAMIFIVVSKLSLELPVESLLHAAG